jgi:hypothetical protein
MSCPLVALSLSSSGLRLMFLVVLFGRPRVMLILKDLVLAAAAPTFVLLLF